MLRGGCGLLMSVSKHVNNPPKNSVSQCFEFHVCHDDGTFFLGEWMNDDNDNSNNNSDIDGIHRFECSIEISDNFNVTLRMQ